MRNNFRPLVWLGRYSLAAGLALGVSTSAMAQDEAPAATAEAPAAEEAKGEEEKVETLYVTGSRLKRLDLDTPAPVTIVTKQQIEASGLVNIGEVLQQLPQVGGTNLQVNNGGTGSVTSNVRGYQTVILLNGRRMVGVRSGGGAAVDMSMIPSAVVERVEILKDGASAIYGADAVGGVINIITKEDFVGAELTAYTGISERGDGLNVSVNGVVGADVGDGNVWVALDYTQQGSVMAGDREFSKYDKEYLFGFSDEELAGYGLISPAYISGSSSPIWGRYGVTCVQGQGSAELQAICDEAGYDPETGAGANLNVTIGEDGSLQVFNTSGSRDAPGTEEFPKGDYYNYQPDNYLFTPSSRAAVMSHGIFPVGDETDVFYEVALQYRGSEQQLAPTPLFAAFDLADGTIPADQQFNPLGVEINDYRHRMAELGTRNFIQDVLTYRAAVGAAGALPGLDGWDWDISATYGKSSLTEVSQGNLYRDRMQYALQGCTAEEAGADCQVYNPFPYVDADTYYYYDDPQGVQELERLKSYLLFEGEDTSANDQFLIDASVNGALFELPGGDAQLAVGYQFRRESGEYVPDAVIQEGNTTGNAQDATKGDFSANDVFAELSLPLANGMTGVENLELGLAGRYSNYDSFGGQLTYKAGLTYSPVKEFTLRGTYGTAYNAPSISALYGGTADGYPSVTDPCSTFHNAGDLPANCADVSNPDDRTQILTRNGSNPDLDPEQANILTAGFVVNPIEELSLTVDYFLINYYDTVTSKGAATILQGCYSQDASQSNAEDCAKITRDPDTNLITEINDTLTNVGMDITAGWDVELKGDFKVGGGLLGTTTTFTYYTVADTFLLNPAAENPYYAPSDEDELEPLKRYKGIYEGSARWSLQTGLNYAFDGIGAGINVRYTPTDIECADGTCYEFTGVNADNPNEKYFENELFVRDVDDNLTADIYASYALDTEAGSTTFTLGVNNITDQDPPLIYQGFYADSSPAYDFLGRYFYLNVGHSF